MRPRVPAPTAGSRRPRLWATVLATGLLLTSCGDSGATSPRSTTTPAPTTSLTRAARAEGMRDKRYCEVLLVRVADGRATADVYNTFPLNDCPAPLWSALDVRAIARAEGVTVAVLNGPRFWLMDSVEKQGGSAALPRKSFGGLEMYRQASLDIGPLAEASKPYVIHAVDRATVFTFDAGRSIHELTGPDGTPYVMQTWSQQKDPTLGESDLDSLGDRLSLPTGWTYRTRTLDAPLRVVTTSTAAHVLQDDLGNSYSQETSG